MVGKKDQPGTKSWYQHFLLKFNKEMAKKNNKTRAHNADVKVNELLRTENNMVEVEAKRKKAGRGSKKDEEDEDELLNDMDL